MLSAPVSLFSAADAGTAPGGTFRGLTITISGVVDLAYETIMLDGTPIVLGYSHFTGNGYSYNFSGTTAGHGLSYSLLADDGQENALSTMTITL